MTRKYLHVYEVRFFPPRTWGIMTNMKKGQHKNCIWLEKKKKKKVFCSLNCNIRNYQIILCINSFYLPKSDPMPIFVHSPAWPMWNSTQLGVRLKPEMLAPNLNHCTERDADKTPSHRKEKRRNSKSVQSIDVKGIVSVFYLSIRHVTIIAWW